MLGGGTIFKMKIQIKRTSRKPFGVELSPENKAEQKILQRFWEGGIKLNAYSIGNGSLQLTFRDLIK